MSTQKIHYISGIIIAVFVGLHLFNHLSSLLGIEMHIEVMNHLRVLYRNIFVEVGLLSAVFIQIISGLRLFNTSRKSATTLFEKLHIGSGLYLAIFFLFHVSAVLGGRFLLHLDTNIYFGVAGLHAFPLNLFFIPYYGLSILSFFGHIAAIHHKKMKRNLLGLTPHLQAVSILGVGVVVTFLVFYGLTNHFHGVTIPQPYHVLMGK